MTPDGGDPRHPPLTLDATPGPDGRWRAAPAPAQGWIARLAKIVAWLAVAAAAVLLWVAALALVIVLAPLALLAGWWLWRKAGRGAGLRGR